MFFCGFDNEEVPALLKVTAEGSLAKSDKFNRCLSAVGGEDQQLAVYADVSAIYAVVDKFVPPAETQPAGSTPGPADGPVRAANEFRRALKALGLDKVTAIAGATRVVDGGMYSRCKLFAPGPFEGILSPAAGKPLTDADLARLPQDADIGVVSAVLDGGNAPGTPEDGQDAQRHGGGGAGRRLGQDGQRDGRELTG